MNRRGPFAWRRDGDSSAAGVESGYISPKLINQWLTGALDAAFAKPRGLRGRSRTKVRRLLRSAAVGLVKSAKKDQAADGAKWQAAAQLWRSSAEVGHGFVLDALQCLNILCGGMLPIRTVNRKKQIINGWVSMKLGERVTMGTLRRNPWIIVNFDFKEFYAALRKAGSERALFDQVCRRPAKGGGALPDSNASDSQPTPASRGFENVRQRVRDLATVVHGLPADQLPPAAAEVEGLLETIKSSIRRRAVGGCGATPGRQTDPSLHREVPGARTRPSRQKTARAATLRNGGWKPRKRPRK
jgi:hypothetical protein